MLRKIRQFLFENQGLKQKIAKNTFWLFSGQVFGRLIRVAVVIYAARILGPSSWGAFSYAMSLVAFMTIFSDMGVGAIVTRESVRDPGIGDKYFSTAFFIKIMLLAAGSAILIFGAPYVTNIEEVKSLLPLISLVLVFDSLRNFGFAVSRAKEKMQLEGINEIVTNLVIAILGIGFLAISPTSRALVMGYVIAIGLGFLIIAWQLKNYFYYLAKNFDLSLAGTIIKSSWPFAMASFLGAIMINTDVIMIGWLRSPAEVGFYSAAQRPIQLLYVLPSLFATSLFPTLTKLANQDNHQFREILETSLATALLFALPIAAGGIILGDQIINLLFGPAYQAAVTAFQVLLLTLVIVFPSVIISNSIFAYNQQKRFVTFSTLGAAGNLLFNFLLIPQFGIVGCAISTIATQIIANAFIWNSMKEINQFSIFNKMKKIIIATIAAAILVFLLRQAGANVILNITSAALVYFLALNIQKEKLLAFLRN